MDKGCIYLIIYRGIYYFEQSEFSNREIYRDI
jgi:hypothetical protein